VRSLFAIGSDNSIAESVSSNVRSFLLSNNTERRNAELTNTDTHTYTQYNGELTLPRSLPARENNKTKPMKMCETESKII
jgi:hypothetical protein